MAQWNSHTVPKCETKKCSDEVLVTVEHIGYLNKLYREIVKAVYFPYHHCTVEDMGCDIYDDVPDDLEYAEEYDSWWIPQGWYEVCDYGECFYSTITDKVTAWMKLPKPYKPKVKEFRGVQND